MNREEINPNGSILLVKLGTHPELATIARQIRDLLKGVRVIGIGTDSTTTDDVGEAVVYEKDLMFGSYDEWWKQQMFVDPDLYRDLLAKEGQLLRMAERAARSNIFEARQPSFPATRFAGDIEGGMQLLLRQFAFWDSVIQHNQVKAAVFQSIPHNFWDATLFAVAESRLVPTLCFHEVWPFINSTYIYENPMEMGDLTIGENLLTIAHQRFGLIPDSGQRRERMLSQVTLADAVRGRQIGAGSSLRIHSRVGALLRTPRFIPQKVIRSLLRRKKLRETIEDYESVANRKGFPQCFFFMELQRSANMTSLVKGFMYGDAREMIAHVASSLPSNFELVVRESSRSGSSRGIRRKGFWHQVAAIPRVHIVSSDTQTEAILEKTLGMVELGYSSLALEALNRGIPVVVLGLTHLHGAPNTFVVTESSKLRHALQAAKDCSRSSSDRSMNVALGLQDWADKARLATIEGRLSSDRNTAIQDPNYRARLIGNTARVIAAWYEMKQT
jgi:hypothetical protein